MQIKFTQVYIWQIVVKNTIFLYIFKLKAEERNRQIEVGKENIGMPWKWEMCNDFFQKITGIPCPVNAYKK